MDKIQCKKMVLGLAAFYRDDRMNDAILEMYYQVLKDLTAEEMERAVKACISNADIKFMPLPAVLCEAVRPTLSIDDAAQELLGRTMDAVGKFGWCDPNGAEKFLGPIAWSALGQASGWTRFCEHDNPGTARAQLRDVLKSKLRQANPEGRVKSLTSPELGPKLPISAGSEKLATLTQDLTRRLGVEKGPRIDSDMEPRG